MPGTSMSRPGRRSAAAIAAILAIGAAGCASSPRTVDVPDKLKPPAGESLIAVAAARGVQIYECREKKDQAGAYEWAFVAPEADLFDARGTRIGRHYAGPTWESTDGSKVQGTVKERADAPAAGAIPWLLLTARSPGPDGAFGKVTSIQRVNTAGGLAPAAACSRASAAAPARVPYTADYYFFAPTR